MGKVLSMALAFPALVLVAGCVTDNQATQAQREALRSVSVNESVAVPENPQVFLSTAALLSAVTTLTGTNPMAKNLKQFLARARIDIAEIVREEFTRRLTEARVFPAVVADAGEGRFSLAIQQYGLFDAQDASLGYQTFRPVVSVSATLTNTQGQVVWTKSASSARADEDPGAFRVAEYAADPKLLRDAFARAARAASILLLLDLGGVPAHVDVAALPSARGMEAAMPGGLPAVGTTWTYSFTDHVYSRRPKVVTIQVVRSAGTIVQEAISTDAPGDNGSLRIVNVRQPRILEYRIDGSASLIEVAPYLLAADGGEPPAMPKFAGYPTGGTGSWRITSLKRDWQEIATPAGTFRALKYELSGDYTGASRSLAGNPTAERFTIEVWYAPDVRRIARIRHRSWGRYSDRVLNRESVELIAYRRPS